MTATEAFFEWFFRPTRPPSRWRRFKETSAAVACVFGPPFALGVIVGLVVAW
jgi:hypothetical protein